MTRPDKSGFDTGFWFCGAWLPVIELLAQSFADYFTCVCVSSLGFAVNARLDLRRYSANDRDRFCL
jgi:hypothetical protein